MLAGERDRCGDGVVFAPDAQKLGVDDSGKWASPLTFQSGGGGGCLHGKSSEILVQLEQLFVEVSTHVTTNAETFESCKQNVGRRRRGPRRGGRGVTGAASPARVGGGELLHGQETPLKVQSEELGATLMCSTHVSVCLSVRVCVAQEYKYSEGGRRIEAKRKASTRAHTHTHSHYARARKECS